MLYTPDAKFHIRLIPFRWYHKDKDPNKESFLVVITQDSIIQYEHITNIQLYGKISGLTRKITMKAVKERDLRIINFFEDYLKGDEQEDESNVDDNELDKENDPLNIGNPNKKTRSKGHPKGTRRIKANYERKTLVNSGNK
ncbi:unnamed protein product [Rhizophagus irregularis]|nr:unnamed protein product [Rhizophagus irregularis]CAB4407096.1 unnamed protein product [Rhizophagus irregularis]